VNINLRIDRTAVLAVTRIGDWAPSRFLRTDSAEDPASIWSAAFSSALMVTVSSVSTFS
jgi:hypothetical protein